MENIREPYVYTLPERFVEDPQVPARWRIYTVIKGFHLNGKPCYASNEWFMKKLKCSEPTVSAAIKELEEMGEIVCERTRRSRVCKIQFDPSQLGSRPKSTWVSDPSQLGTNSVSNSVNIFPCDSATAEPRGESLPSKPSVSSTARSLVDVDEDGMPLERKKPIPKYPNAKEVFDLFVGAYQPFWNKHTTYLKAAQTMYDTYGLEQIKKQIQHAIDNQDDQFCPIVDTPSKLLQKWSNLIAHKNR